jgi:hypothetical protein
MTETLLSPSNILLIGRVVEDLNIVDPIFAGGGTVIRVRAASPGVPVVLNGPQVVDGVNVTNGHVVLVKDQVNPVDNGIYQVGAGAWTRVQITTDADLESDFEVRVRRGTVNAGTRWMYFGDEDREIGVDNIVFVDRDPTHSPFVRRRGPANNELLTQLQGANRCFARIYGFSYEGTYYDLPQPSLFMVHGRGIRATQARDRIGNPRPARAPGSPSLTGVAAADFQFADDARVWSYDKADYTIRMDVATGMFDDVLIDPFFGGDGGGVSGARVSGARVSGARVSGARVSGARISGARLSGGRGDATD